MEKPHKNQLKWDMTDVAMQNIGDVSNLGPHMTVALLGFEKNLICAIQTVRKKSFGQKVRFGSLLPAV